MLVILLILMRDAAVCINVYISITLRDVIVVIARESSSSFRKFLMLLQDT